MLHCKNEMGLVYLRMHCDQLGVSTILQEQAVGQFGKSTEELDMISSFNLHTYTSGVEVPCLSIVIPMRSFESFVVKIAAQ